MKNSLYNLKEISFCYALGSCQIEALKNISLTIPKNSFITLSGPSGSGKSTLLNILGLIEPIHGGSMLFQEGDVSKMTQRELNVLRKYKIGFIFQQFHLIPVFTAEENVAYFLARQGLAKKEILLRTEEALAAVGLIEHRLKKPSQLSGGQRQRVAIARALAKRPEVIIGDEPTASLDQRTGKEIMDIFCRLASDHGVTIILSTHDKMVQSYAEQNISLNDGMLESA